MLAMPAPWRLKLLGIGLGFLAIQAMNLLRIITLFYLGQWNDTLFEWAHLYVWQALIMLDVLIVFILWLRFIPARKARKHAA
jgi:exosortase H (IPTLxxWG-CTERM-specific)